MQHAFFHHRTSSEFQDTPTKNIYENLLNNDEINFLYGLVNDVKYLNDKNNINAGTAKVTIAGIGAYGGTRDISFKIVSKSMDYNIKFDKNDSMARGKMSTITVPAGTKLPSNAYTLNGKNFKCWCTKPSVEDLFAQTYVNGEKFERKGISILSFGDDVTLYAIWE